MKALVRTLLTTAFETARNEGELSSPDLPFFVVEVPKDPSHGDFASNLALVLARGEKRPPREIASILSSRIPDREDVSEVTMAGPGFLNFRFRPGAWQRLVDDIRNPAGDWGVPRAARRERVQVEFVSANPTGPLTVGHGRNAVVGDTIARLLEARGHEVAREYYFNNAGRQMKVLGESVRARYLECLGDAAAFPEDGYQGEYITEIAEALVEEHGDRLRGAVEEGPFRDAAEKAIFADIRRTLERMRIELDVYFNEDALYAGGAIEDTLERLRAKGVVYESEGATWIRLSELGLRDDKVLVKSTGEPAYRLPDVAYHENKIGRGFDRIIDVLGADHIDETQEVKAALKALGHDPSRVRTVLYQFVTLVRDGRPVKMSTRKATFVTLDELLDEVGVDVVRFLFLTRKSDTHLEFDLDVAKSQSLENPVYYVQYAHARIANIRKKAASAGLDSTGADLTRLGGEDALGMIRKMAEFPEMVAAAAEELEPHRVPFYLQELAGAFHSFYNRPENRVVGVDPGDGSARLALVEAVQRVLAEGLGLLGVTTPDQM